MKLTSTLLWNRWQKNGRRPISPLMRLGLARELKPLELKNKVGRTKSEESDVVCIPQMMSMLNCLKVNEFDQSLCSKEITAFQNCYNQHVSKKQAESQENLSSAGLAKLSRDQMNELLSKWKQPK